eukprot:249299_1
MAEQSAPLILVTGSSGYIAGYIIQLALKRGYRVRGTVRALNKSKYSYLYAMDTSNSLELVVADLTKDNKNWIKIISDIDYIIHTAHPMPSRNVSQMSDEKYSAVSTQGMQNILNACLKNKQLKKFILTSSIAAMGSDCPNPSKIVNEISPAIWQDLNDPNLTPYARSKTLSEKTLWDFIEKNKVNWTATSVNPGAVLGPLLTNHKSTSLDTINAPLNGEYPVIPPMQLPYCDVRDVAQIHINALETEKSANKRYVAIAQSLWFKDVCNILVDKYGKDGYNIPTFVVPGWVFRFYGLFDATVHDIICPAQYKIRCYDNTDVVRDLGIAFQPIHETIYETADSLIKYKFVKKPSQSRKRIKYALMLSVTSAIGYFVYKRGWLEHTNGIIQNLTIFILCVLCS